MAEVRRNHGIVRRSGRALFIFIGYLAQLVPWFFIGRITFAYHYFPSVLFLVLALCYVFHTLAEREEMVNWKPSSSVRSRRPPAVPENDPLTTMAGGNEVMYHAG